MDQKYNTSFIPKKFLSEDVGGSSSSKYVTRRGVMGPGYFLAVLIFIIAALVSVGLFGYIKATQQRVDDKIDNIKKQSTQVTADDVNTLLRIHKRFSNASLLLSKHISASELFKILEQQTLQDVRYSKLSYRGQYGDGSSGLSLSGQSTGFQQVALQAKQFGKDQYLNTPVVTKLSSAEGKVLFDINVRINPLLILFDAAVSDGRRARASAITETVQTPTPPQEEAATQ